MQKIILLVLHSVNVLHPIPDLSSPSPTEVVFPNEVKLLTPAWVLYYDPAVGGKVWVNGAIAKENFLSPDTVMALKVSGDIQCGLLHVHVSVPRLNLITPRIGSGVKQ